jgi:predicted metal-dependent RNase
LKDMGNNLIEQVTGLPKKGDGVSIKSMTAFDEVQRSLLQLANQESSINLDNAVSVPQEQQKKVSFTVKPVLRSVDIETGDDVETSVQRLVGGEVKVTVKF